VTVFQAPKGVPDYFPPRSRAFLAVQDALASPPRRAGYEYVELPVFEDTGLFIRGVGESTDVVSKEMYTFTDRGDRSLTLRPEGTAGVMRVVVEHGLDNGQLPVKLWYRGPFFRAERPQQGRYRQLQQVGIEAIGSDDPVLDAEVIALAAEGFRNVGLTKVDLHLTSLGCAQCRPAYRELLQEFLRTCDLDAETQSRAQLNPLRVLDDKRPEIQDQLVSAPLMVDHLCADCQSHYDQVRSCLRLLGVEWTEAPRMVRGLDYYTRTTFEFSHPLLGAQSGIGGGGRYDGLMSSIGGAELSGIGFGLGVDRTLLAAEAEGISVGSEHPLDVYAVGIGAAAKESVVRLVQALRTHGLRTDMAFGDRGLKGAMKAAGRSGAVYAVIIGEDEVAAGTVRVKDLRTGEQQDVSGADVVAVLAQALQEASTTSTHDKIGS
jgi:histidyl-tRNA synthetase